MNSSVNSTLTVLGNFGCVYVATISVCAFGQTWICRQFVQTCCSLTRSCLVPSTRPRKGTPPSQFAAIQFYHAQLPTPLQRTNRHLRLQPDVNLLLKIQHSLRRFHDEFLSWGAIPVTLIARLMRGEALAPGRISGT